MLNCQEWKVNQIIAGSIITFGGFGFGTALSWTATGLPSLEKTGQVGVLSQVELSWIASVMTIGALVSCPITGLFLKNHGRKPTLISFCAVGFAGWILQGAASNTLQLYFARTLIGASAGGCTILVPTYIGEVASKENRGLIGSMFLIMLCFGKLFSNIIGIFFPANISSILCSLHPVVYAFSLLLIPESPKILMKQETEGEAFRALLWYETKGFGELLSYIRKRKISIQYVTLAVKVWATLETMKPISMISKDVEDPKNFIAVPKPKLFSSNVLRPIITVFVLMVLAQFCGINISTFYTVEIFRLCGDFFIKPDHATVIVALIQTIGCLPCSIFVDKYGRKVLIASSFFVMGIAMATFSGFFYYKQITDLDILVSKPYIGLVPLVSLIMYNLAYSWGVGSIIWIIMSEIIPQAFIGPVSAIANVIFWGSAFFVLQSFQMFKELIPMFIWFTIFTLVCIIGCIFIVVALPETKGLSLEEIQEFYAKPRSTSSNEKK